MIFLFLPKIIINQNVFIMKKLSLLIIILIATCTVALAQPRAVGGRIGFGIGASYQHEFGDKNMLQVDLDVAGFYSIQATATYNWIFPISSWSGPGSWNYYAGVGFGAGYAWWGDWVRWVSRAYGGAKFGGYGAGHGCGFVGVAGMIGVEYNFKFPMQISVDYRPIIGPCFYKKGVNYDKKGKERNADYYYSGLVSSAISVALRYNF